MTLAEKLSTIQCELKAPKSEFNAFGRYKYRSFENICEAVKPLLKKHGCTLTVSDNLELIGDRYYIAAYATVRDTEGGDVWTVKGYAQEAADKKGMDASQITGTASSYARKYALGGLFLLDDTKDADTDEHRRGLIASLFASAEEKGITAETLLNAAGVTHRDKLTLEQITALQARVDKSKGKGE